jgi:hypothetical protein
VFSLGLYKLFVGRVDAAEGSETASRLLYVRSLDDLKNKVVKLILLILAMESSNAPYTCATIAHSNSSTSRAASCSSAGLST